MSARRLFFRLHIGVEAGQIGPVEEIDDRSATVSRATRSRLPAARSFSTTISRPARGWDASHSRSSDPAIPPPAPVELELPAAFVPADPPVPGSVTPPVSFLPDPVAPEEDPASEQATKLKNVPDDRSRDPLGRRHAQISIVHGSIGASDVPCSIKGRDAPLPLA